MKLCFTKYIRLVIISAMFLLCRNFFAQASPLALFQNKVSNPADTSKANVPLIMSDSVAVDTTQKISVDTTITDTTKKIPVDTTKYSIPNYHHGSLFLLPYQDYRSFSKENIQYDNYSSLFDILKTRLAAYPLFLGSFGHFNSFSVNGGRPRDFALMFNGRPLLDPDFGSINLDQYSPEFMERAEILTGSDAVIFSDNSSGAAINIVEPIYNTKYTFTRIWYSQAGSNFLGGDAIISHNFAPNWNLTLGFRRTSADNRVLSTGIPANSFLDAWNIRGLVRWNPSDRTSLSLAENFSNQGIGDFGGTDSTFSVPVYQGLNEKVFRHDLTFSFNTFLASDSVSAISGTAFFSHADWYVDRPREIVPDTSIPTLTRHITRQSGGTFKYEQGLTKYFTLRTGGELNYISADNSAYTEGLKGLFLAAYGHGELKPFEFVKLSGGVRISSIQEHQLLAFGAKAMFDLDTSFSLVVDLSRSQRMPTPAEGLTLRNEENYLAIAELGWESGYSTIAVNSYLRKTNSPINSIGILDTNGVVINTRSENGSTEISFGGDLSASTRLYDHLYLSGRLQTNISTVGGVNTLRFPLLYSTFRAYYDIIRGRSMAAFGFSYNFLSKFKGERFVPLTRSYIANGFESNIGYTGLDVFAFARLGSAFVKVAYENVLSNVFSDQYYYVPAYPVLEGNIRLSVAWSFTD